MAGRDEKGGYADSMVKNLELVVAVIVIPHFLQVMILPRVIANSLGVLISCIVMYWVPPKSRLTLRQWILSGLFAAIFVLIFTSMVKVTL